MRKQFARTSSTLMISTILAAVLTVCSAATLGVHAASADSTVTFAPVPQPLQAKVAQMTVLEEKPMHREMRSATSKNAKDHKGYEKSLYRGKYYHSDQESFRKCVMKRESHFSYRSANKVSSARGAYQFLDRQWRDGLVWMMLKESKKTKDGLAPKIQKLFKKPIHKWNRYFQDRAFFTALNAEGKWSGKKHWNATVPGTGC